MPKRRRLLTPIRKKQNNIKIIRNDERDNIKAETTPRGRLKGALLDALDPFGEESDVSVDHTPSKRESQDNRRDRKYSSDDDEHSRRKRSPNRQSYVLKLFDRSVDLSQFDEDSPLYPICRAWIANQPKVDYNAFGKKYEDPYLNGDRIELPGPEGPPVSRIPKLLPDQAERSKSNINLNYREAPPPSREILMQSHMARWAAVRQTWLEQAARVETRYESTQRLLNQMNVNAI